MKGTFMQVDVAGLGKKFVPVQNAENNYIDNLKINYDEHGCSNV